MLRDAIAEIVMYSYNGSWHLFIRTEPEYRVPSLLDLNTDRVAQSWVISDEDGEFHAVRDDSEVYVFGYLTHAISGRPGHGGYWSSRESVVGPLIDRCLVPVAINGVAASLPVKVVEDLLPEGYCVQPKTFRYGNDETFYEVQGHSPNGSHRVTVFFVNGVPIPTLS